MGNGLYDKFINMVSSNQNQLFEGEKHIPLIMPNGKIEIASWVGPGTQVISRLKRGDKGKTATDFVAMRHDLDYSVASNLDDIRTADQRMINKLNQIQKNKGDNIINILAGKKAIQTKVYLEDSGLLDKNKFADLGGNNLNEADRQLIFNKIKELEQIGYGLSKKNVKPLYSDEIEEQLKFIPFFKGVYARDQLKQIKVKKNENLAIVINLENSNQGGSHWVCLYNDKNLPYVEYYDSYGLEPPIEVEHFINSKLKKPIHYNPFQLQKAMSNRCGYFCIHYIIKRYAGMQPDFILSKFTKGPSNKNEDLAMDF
jgi:Phospholipase A2-like domain